MIWREVEPLARKQHYRDRFKMASLPHSCAPRNELMRTFQLAASKPLIIVTGPSGSGKTVSTRMWIRTSDRIPVWISLDKSNDSLLSFYQLFCLGLCSAQPDNREMAELLEGGNFRASPVEYTLSLVALLKPDSQRYVIVLDDMHLVQSEEVRKSLVLVLSALPSSFVVVIISQTPSDQDFIPQEKQNNLAHIDAKALSFTPDETVICYRAHGREITSDEAEAICSLSNELVIDIVALASSGLTAVGSGNQNLFADCIEADYWNVWDERTKTFLIKTSIVEVVTPEIAVELTGESDSEGILERLCSETFFISRTEGPAYKYHHLLRMYLHEKADENEAIALEPLYECAAQYHLSNNEIFLARRCALMSGNVEAISKTSFEINQADGVISVAEFVSIYRDYFSSDAPEVFCEKNPYLYSQYAGYYALTGQAEKASHCYEELFHRLGTIAFKHTRFLPDAILMLLVNHTRSLLSILDKVAKLPVVPDLGDRLKWSTLTMQMPFSHRSGRDYSEFCDDKAFERATILRDILGSRAGAIVDLVRAGLLWEQNRLDESAALLDKLREPVLAGSNSELMFCHLIQSAAVHDAMRREGLAEEVIVQADDFVNQLENAYYRPNLEAFKTRFALADGNRRAAQAWLENYYVVDTGTIEMYRIYAHFTTVRAYIVLGQTDEAEEYLLRLQTMAEAFNRPIDVCEALALQASIKWALGQKDAAVDYLERALSLVQHNRIIRVFAEEGAAIMPVLKALRSRCEKEKRDTYLELPYLDEVIQAAREQADRRKGITCRLVAPTPKLSKQQLNVLGLVAQGYRNTEIARRTGLALSTVKFHLGEAYKKLGVSSAEDAVAKAREVGLL